MSKNLVTAAKRPVVASDYRPRGQCTERIVAANGEVNASSKADLLKQGMMLAQATGLGQVMTAETAARKETAAKVNKELLKAAFSDPQAHRVLGERIANEIYMTGNRSGFLRRFLTKMDLKQGDIPRFPVRMKQVQASVMTGRDRLETQFVQDKYLMPPEFSVGTRIYVHQIDLHQNSSDVLEEKYTEALEGTMVAEDRMLMAMANSMVGIDNNRQIISGTLSPQALMNLRGQITAWNLKAPYMLLASDLWADIVGDPSFSNVIDPVSKHELLMTGTLATLFGMELITEAYRHPEHKVMGAGEMVVFADALTLGAYSDRNGVDSAPIDITTERVPGKGWVLNETMSMAIGNSRGVAFGRRI
jgi:hypothetical protein